MDNKKDLNMYFDEIYLASFNKRLLASLIDGAILTISTMLLLYIKNFGFPMEVSMSDSLIILIIGVLYEVLLIYFFGMTIGKRIMKIKVISNFNDKLSLKQAILRCIYGFLSGYVLYIGYLWMIRDKLNQTWHDMLANTLVINSEDENEMIQYVMNNPCKVSNKSRIIKISILLLILFIFSYSNLNKFVNKTDGNFGLKEFYTKEFNEAFLNTKFFDIDKDNDAEMITLSEKNKGLSMNIYDWKDDDLVKINSFILEKRETFIEDWAIGDLDNNGMFEVAVCLKQDNKKSIKIYKKTNDSFTIIDSLEYKRDIEIIKDKDGKKHLIGYYNGTIVFFSFSNGKLEKEYNNKISTVGVGITKADFDGDGIDQLYFIKDKYDKNGNVKCIFIKIDPKEDSIIETNAGEIDLYSNVRKGELYYPRNFMVYDINGNGKDDVVFQITSVHRSNTWFNTFECENGKWAKIYSGGYLDDIEKYEIWRLFFLGKADINGDGTEELVMGGDLKHAYWNERDGEAVENRIIFYRVDSIKFFMNNVFQRMNSVINNILPFTK